MRKLEASENVNIILCKSVPWQEKKNASSKQGGGIASVLLPPGAVAAPILRTLT
jgi:hypothetical protein